MLTSITVTWENPFHSPSLFIYKVVEEPLTKYGGVYDGTVVVIRMWSYYENLSKCSTF